MMDDLSDRLRSFMSMITHNNYTDRKRCEEDTAHYQDLIRYFTLDFTAQSQGLLAERRLVRLMQHTRLLDEWCIQYCSLRR